MEFRKKLIVKPGDKVNLSKVNPNENFGIIKDEDVLERIEAHNKKLAELQFKLYAENKRSLLIVLQGMDAAGKDGVINHVLAALNPQGCRAQSFKTPSTLEMSHDFLWRIHLAAPKRGEIVIFNRSHYEDVLIQRVHNIVPEKVWRERYELINDFEKLLVKSNTTIVKFYLHISPEEQLSRFKDRLDDRSRQWKISTADYDERKLWPDYQEAFEEVFKQCSTDIAPWYIIPSNRKYFRNLAVSSILLEVMRDMKMEIPPVTVNIKEVQNEYKQAKAWEKAGKDPSGH